MINGYQRERCFVGIICRKLEELGINGVQASKAVFQERSSAPNAWRSIRNFRRPKKPRGLSLGEAIRFADLVGEPLHAILVEVEYAIKSGWDLDKDDPSPACQDKTERKPKRQKLATSNNEEID